MDLVELQVDPTLELRMLTEPDSAVLFALVEDNRSYLKRWLPWVDDNTEEAHTLAFIESTLDEHERGEALHMGIWQEGRLCGVVGFNSLKAGHEGEIGYWLDQSLQGSGVMTKACGALVDYGFREVELRRVIILCDPKNVRSRRIAERLGFQVESANRAVRYVKEAPGG